MPFWALTVCAFLVWQICACNASIAANVCNTTSKTCCIWNDTNIADVLDVIDATGWTLLVDACGRQTPVAASTPLACTLEQTLLPSVSIQGGYITTANTAIRSMQSASSVSVSVALTEDAYSSVNEYPCTSFFVQAPNVSIEFFSFTITGCVSVLAQTRAISGLPPSDIWMYATPIIAQDKDNNLALMHLSHLTLLGGGDAVARILPDSPDDIINIDGAQFYNVVGTVNTSSPITHTDAIAFAVVIGPANGVVTLSQTAAIGFGGDIVGVPVLGQWLGVQTGVSPPSCKPTGCPQCGHCAPPHPDTAATTAIAILATLFSGAIPVYCVYLIVARIQKLETQKAKNA